MKDLKATPTRPPWLEAQRDLPFTTLTGDEFEVFCYRLLRQENPGEEIHYYGKTRDAGRDIVRPKAPTGSELIQCKRYGASVGIGEVRRELAKLYTNVFRGVIPERPDRVTFYVAPDLTNQAKDLLRYQARWAEKAEAALRDHLGSEPPAELLEFARTWWPNPGYQTALELTERATHHEDLIDSFFSVKKVLAIKDFRKLLREERSQAPERTTGPEGKWESFFQAVGQPEQFFFYVQEWPGLLPDQRFLAPENLAEIREAVSREPLTFLIGPPAAGKTFTAVQLLWEAYQRELRVLWIAPPTFAATDGPIPEERSFGDMKERIRLLAHRLGPKPLQAPRDSYDFIAQHLEPGSLVYIEDPFGKKDEEFTYSLHTYDFFDLDAFIAAIQKGGSRKDCHILISSREGLFDRWQDDLKARGEERPPAKRFRIDANSYTSKEAFELARKIAQAQNLQDPEGIAAEVAYWTRLPFEIEKIIRGLPPEATVDDAERAALGWQGDLVSAVRRQLQSKTDAERLLLVATALEWPRATYLRFYGELGFAGTAEDALGNALSRFGSLITQKQIVYMVPGRFRLHGKNDGPRDLLFIASHSAVTEGIAEELATCPEWLSKLATALSEQKGRHEDLAVYLLALGIGRTAGPVQDAIVTILFDKGGLTGRYMMRFMRLWPLCDTTFKEKMFQYLETDPTNVVRDLAARLVLVEVLAEDAWRLLRLLLKERYLVAGGQPGRDLFGEHPWRYLVQHIDEVPADLAAALDELAAKRPSLFTYALGEVLVERWKELPESYKRAFLSEPAIQNEQVQEKVLRAIASRWNENPEELKSFFLKQASQGNWQVRVAAVGAAWIYSESNPEVLEPIYRDAVNDPDIRVPLAALHPSGKDERDRRFAEALLQRVDGETAADMLQTILREGLGNDEWKTQVARSCLEKGGELARGVLAERHFSTTPPRPYPFFVPPASLGSAPEVVRLGAIHAYADSSGDRSFLSEEDAIALVEGLSRPYRDWAFVYLSIQALNLPEKVRVYIERLEEAESEDGQSVREGKESRQPKDRRRLWKFPVLWLAEALKEVETAS
jgi:Restriction endonuclease